MYAPSIDAQPSTLQAAAGLPLGDSKALCGAING